MDSEEGAEKIDNILDTTHLTVEAPNQSGTLLDEVPQEKQLHVAFWDIKGWVPTATGPPSLFPSFGTRRVKGKPEQRQIMHDIKGNCKPGEVLALMGPSGSSKTTLLSALGGRTHESVKLEGTVLFNNEKLTKRIKKHIGYVLQDDLLFAAITVQDTLYYAAMLRLPHTMSKAEKLERVETVIKTLGLEKCRNTIIGGGLLAGFFRGVSGGERKRVSIGHELLTNPSAIFLDEPTSGLDSTSAMHLLQTLRRLASGGRAVITTIHQPGSRLYMQLDKLLLLSDGHIIYYGQASIAAKWFSTLGYELPLGINQADFLLDLASGEIGTYKLKGEAARLHCIACAEKFLLTHPDGYFQETSLNQTKLGTQLWSAAKSRKKLKAESGMDKQRSLASSIHSSIMETVYYDVFEEKLPHYDLEALRQQLDIKSAASSAPTVGNNSAIAKETYGASWPLQFRILLQRALKTRRFEALSVQDISQIFAVGILSGLFWLQAGQTDTIYGATNSNGLLFFLMMFASMRAMIQALFVFPPEFRLIVKERESGMYHISAYYFARLCSDLPIDCTLPTIFLCIVYFMGGLQYSAHQFFATWASVILFVLTAQSFGLLIGAVIVVHKTAQTLTTVVNLSMLLVAGFFVTNIHAWIAWLHWLSFIYYGYSLLLKIQYRGRSLWACGYANTKHHTDLAPGSCSFVPAGQTVQQALRMSRDPNEAPWEAAALIGLLILMRTLVYLGLSMKTRSKVR